MGRLRCEGLRRAGLPTEIYADKTGNFTGLSLIRSALTFEDLMNKIATLSLLAIGASLLGCAFSASAASVTSIGSLPVSASLIEAKPVYAQRVVPAGTTFDVTFTTGLDFTSAFSASNPIPALVDIANPVQITPENAKSDIVKCGALVDGSGYDVTASRGYFRADLLRCEDTHGNYAYEASLEGYLVDGDGKLGIHNSSIAKGDKAQLVLTRDARIFTPQQLGEIAPSKK